MTKEFESKPNPENEIEQSSRLIGFAGRMCNWGLLQGAIKTLEPKTAKQDGTLVPDNLPGHEVDEQGTDPS